MVVNINKEEIIEEVRNNTIPMIINNKKVEMALKRES
jgi:hypothetical protein